MSVSWKAHRDGIHVGVGDAGDQVGGAGAAGGHADAGPAGGAGVAIGGEGAALLVAGQDHADLLRSRERLVDFHARPAGIGEDRVHAFAFEAGHEDLAAGHGGADLGTFGGGSPFLDVSGCCLAHVLFPVAAASRGSNKKPTTVSSRGFLSKFNLTTTSANGVASYDDDDCQHDLSVVVQHLQGFYRRNPVRVKPGFQEISAQLQPSPRLPRFAVKMLGKPGRRSKR